MQPSCHREVLPTVTPLVSLLLPGRLLDGVHGVIRPVLQVADQRPDLVEAVEDIASARHSRQGLCLPGTKTLGPVRDGRFGVEAAIGQFQQPDAPGVGIAVAFDAQEVAVGGMRVESDQDRLAGLEYLVMGTDADAGQILAGIDGAGGFHGLLDDVMDGAERQGGIEDIGEQFADAAQRAVAGQDQTEDELTKPELADRQVEEDIVLGGGRGESVIDPFVGTVDLLVDELTADLVVGSDGGDGPAGQGSQGNLAASVGRQS